MHPHNQYGKNFIQVNFFKSQTDHVWRVTNSSWNRQPPFSPKPTFQNYIIHKMWYFCSTFSLFTYKFKEMASNFFNSWPILCISCILRYHVAGTCQIGATPELLYKWLMKFMSVVKFMDACIHCARDHKMYIPAWSCMVPSKAACTPSKLCTTP